jgi:hypothetical protein
MGGMGVEMSGYYSGKLRLLKATVSGMICWRQAMYEANTRSDVLKGFP